VELAGGETMSDTHEGKIRPGTFGKSAVAFAMLNPGDEPF
jgi:hypothetical protein